MTRRRAAPWISASLAASAVLTGCGGIPVSSTYIDGGQFGTSVKAPAGYATFTAKELGGQDDQQSLLLGFGDRSVNPAAPLSGSSPGGVLRVNVVTGPIENARAAAANAFVADMNALIADGSVTVIEGPVMTTSGNVGERIRWVFSMRLTGSATESLISLTSVIGTGNAGAPGAEAHVLKSLAVGCASECFTAHRDDIRSIEESWRVE